MVEVAVEPCKSIKAEEAPAQEIQAFFHLQQPKHDEERRENKETFSDTCVEELQNDELNFFFVDDERELLKETAFCLAKEMAVSF